MKEATKGRGMWGLFALCVLVGALALWVPGFLLLRAVRFDRFVAFASAPAVALAAYGVMCVVYDKLGVFASFVSMVAPLTLLAIAVWAAAFGMRKMRAQRAAGCPAVTGVGDASAACEAPARDLLAFNLDASEAPAFLRKRFKLKIALLFMLVGFAVASVFFGSTLRNATDYVQGFDNMHHLGMVRTFAESGCWSPINVLAYPPDLRDSIMPTAGWPFYPTLLYCVAAMMVSLLSAPIPLALNAANFLFVGVVLPANMMLLLGYLFRENPRALAAGALLSFSFVTFPWQFMNWGPLYPNLASFALLPTSAFAFLAIFMPRIKRKERLAAVLLLVVSLVALVLAQTNAVFTLAVFLIPFLVAQAMRVPAYVGNRTSTLPKRLVAAAIAIAAIAAFWFFLFRLPFLGGVVGYVWQPYTNVQGALGNVLLLSFRATGVQVIMGALVLAGAVRAARDSRWRWILVAYMFMCLIYVIASVENSFLKQLLAGFWYTDAMRLGASAAFFAVPLACLGLASAFDAGLRIAAHYGLSARRTNVFATGVVAVLVCLVVAGFAPVATLADDERFPHRPPRHESPHHERPREFFGFESPEREYVSAFDELMKSSRGQTDPKVDNVYGPEESAFVKRAVEIAGDDLVINMPEDGSMFANSIDGLNTYYRYARAVGGEDETEESRVIRRGLRNYAVDPRVQDAVRSIGAKYVLLLDQGDAGRRDSYYFFSYRERDWEGVDPIRDGTPGFEPVLAEGDMRLYRIVDEAGGR